MSNNLDKKNTKELLKQLELLGIEEREACVYIALLSREQVGSSKIISATGLHGQYVYTALRALETKGLVKHVIVNGRRKFSANPPVRIKRMVHEQELIAERVADQLTLLTHRGHEQDFEVYQGKNMFIAHELDVMEFAEPGSKMDIIGSPADQFAEIMGEQMMRYEKLRAEKNILLRYIGSVFQAEELKKMSRTRKHFEYRLLPEYDFGITNTVIRPTGVSLSTFGDPVLTYALTSLEIGKSYQSFFTALWAISSPA